MIFIMFGYKYFNLRSKNNNYTNDKKKTIVRTLLSMDMVFNIGDSRYNELKNLTSNFLNIDDEIIKLLANNFTHPNFCRFEMTLDICQDILIKNPRFVILFLQQSRLR